MLNAATTGAAARRRQGELGQFLTPPPVADFMASLFGSLPGSIRLLDAGAGAGALTAAWVARVCRQQDGVRAVQATLYEVDPLIQTALREQMQTCRRRCDKAGIQFSFFINEADFIQEISSRLGDPLFGSPPAYDVLSKNRRRFGGTAESAAGGHRNE